MKLLKSIFFLLVSLLWIILILGVGTFFTARPFSSSDFTPFLFKFFMTGILLGGVGAIPLFLWVRSVISSPRLKTIVGAFSIIIVLVVSVFYVFWFTDVSDMEFTSVPIPENIASSIYMFEMRDSISPTTTLVLRFDKNLNVEQRVEEMRKVAQFYEEIAKARGGYMRESLYARTGDSCREAIDRDYEVYQRQTANLVKTERGTWYNPSTGSYDHPDVAVDCEFMTPQIRYRMTFSNNFNKVEIRF